MGGGGPIEPMVHGPIDHRPTIVQQGNRVVFFSDLILVFLIEYRQIPSNTVGIPSNTVGIPSEYRQIPSNTVIGDQNVGFQHLRHCRSSRLGGPALFDETKTLGGVMAQN